MRAVIPPRCSRLRCTLSDALRAAIAADPRSGRELGAAAGVPQPSISRFLTGERDLSLASASKLAAALGLELRPRE